MNNCGNKGISGKCLCDFIKMIDNRKPKQKSISQTRRDGDFRSNCLDRSGKAKSFGFAYKQNTKTLPKRKPHLCKGRWHAIGVTEGLLKNYDFSLAHKHNTPSDD